MATEKRYSLVDIFNILKQVNAIYEKKGVIVSSEVEEGIEVETNMSKSEYIAMNVAHELISPYSQLACDTFTAKKKDVEEAMKQAGFNEVAYPNYEYFGLVKRY